MPVDFATPSAAAIGNAKPATPALLELHDIRTEIRGRDAAIKAVDGVSLRISPGESLGMVGESGCGKSMTALSIIGLLPPGGSITAGKVRFDGHELTALSGTEMRHIRGNEIGIVFQDPMTSLNPTMTVFDQVAEPLLLHRRFTPNDIRERVLATLDLVGFPQARERLGSYPHELSGGLRQRVCIAVALVCEPKLLIADEPTTALDVTIQRQILEILDQLRARLGMAILLVTHDLGVIAGHADRVAVMYAGKIVETAATAELFAHPRHRYTEGLFAALPERAIEAHRPLYTIPGRPPDLARPPRGCRFAPRCLHATEECRKTEPPWRHITDTHSFACWHPVPAAGEETPVIPAATPVARPRHRDDDTMASEAAPVVVLNDVVKEYPLGGAGTWFGKPRAVSAVAGVSFSIGRGETFGLVGESGCGKSTIARLVAGLERPTRGNIEVLGENLLRLPKRQQRQKRRDIHLMFQDPAAAMDPRMRGLAILREPFAIQGIAASHFDDRQIARLLEQVGLATSTRDRYPHELSGGQRQRLALARALALQPSLVIADEPVSALDVSVQAQILNLMQDLQRQFGLTYLFVSHNLSVVRYMATNIGVMYLGKMVEIGPADELYLKPLHPYTKGLIDSVPVAQPGTKRDLAIKGELASAIHPPKGCRFHPRCPLAQPLCIETEPPLRVLQNSRRVACHFPLTSGPMAIRDNGQHEAPDTNSYRQPL